MLVRVATWRRFTPEEIDPPIWIKRELGLLDPDDEEFTAVLFAQREGRYGLAEPQWCPLTDDQVAQMVGGSVDPGRGDGFVPPPATVDEVRVRRGSLDAAYDAGSHALAYERKSGPSLLIRAAELNAAMTKKFPDTSLGLSR